MQPYNGDHHISYFQCRCQPRPSPSCYLQNYEHPQLQTQQPTNQPFKSPFSIESLLGGDTSQDMVASSSLPAKDDGLSFTAAKLKRLEERRRSASTFVPNTSQEKSMAGTSAQLQALHNTDKPEGNMPKESDSFVFNHFKHKRPRTMFTMTQLQRMEREFVRRQYITGSHRQKLAQELQLSEAQVRVWFQNRRIKWRKEMISRQLFHGYSGTPI